MSGAQSFGRYRVTGTLGAGAMGEVLAAVDELLGREVAVKTLKGGVSGLAARMADERFRLEARAIAQLTHPSVVQVYDLDLTADPPYLVMERVAGPSLKERLAEGPLPEHEVRALGIQIGNALAAAHARGIVHRDVKPANILGAGPGAWKLADFGVAHVPDSSLTITGQFVGSPAYAAPEALVRGQLGVEGDVFGLGATLYQAAAGTWPRADADVKGLLAPVPPIRSFAPGLPPDLAAAIDRAVAVEPGERPTAAELSLAIAGGTAGPAVAAVALPAAAWSGSATPPAGVAVAGAPVPATPNTISVPDWPAPASATTGGWASGTAGGATAGGATATGGPVTAAGGPQAGGWPAGAAASATSTGGWAHAGAAGTATPPAGTPVVASAAATKYRRKHLVAGIATVLVIALIAVTRCSGSSPPGSVITSPGVGSSAGKTPGSDDGDPRDDRDDRERRDPPSEIRARTPPIAAQDQDAAEDWEKVVDSLYRGAFGEARRKLAEFETKHDESPETRDLASQLDALPEEVLRGGGGSRGRGRGKRGKRGDD